MFDDSNPNLGVYDMRVYLAEDAPKSLHKTLNNNICNKGGGGGGSPYSATGGTGGSGLVIIRYDTTAF